MSSPAPSDPLAVPSASLQDTGGLGGHPRGLTTLFFTEMWERFSYYGMRTLLTLFMVASVTEGGLGWDGDRRATVYGNYTMAVYVLTILGGWIADRFLGAYRSVLCGGITIAMGHFTMAFGNESTFIAGLVLIAAGTGLLKPNISTMVGGLYSPSDTRRDAGFSLFYMGINAGAFLGTIIAPFLAQDEWYKRWLQSAGLDPLKSWHWGFGAAGVGMTLGLIQYLVGAKRLAHVGAKPKPRSTQPTEPLTASDWKRIAAIAILCLFVIIFWALFEQAGSTLNLFADQMTRCEAFGRKFPSGWFQSVNSVWIILLAPLASLLWLKLGNRQPSVTVKFALGLFFQALAFALMVPAAKLATQGLVSPLWLIGFYFLQTVGEIFLSPVGLSTVTKLSPPKLVGLMMGAWFVAAGLGNKLAGELSKVFTNDATKLASAFSQEALFVFGAVAVLLALAPVMKRLMGGIR
jgi:proton-dependent oligopeptide transporter, POT family